MARRYLKAPNYPEAARRAIKAMHQQVGDLVLDESGLALRGILLRHLVMPGDIVGTREIMDWVARELGPNTYINMMAQYRPAGKVSRTEYVEINRRITSNEFESAVAAAHAAGLRRLDDRWTGAV
jgi:putative pyruvate formate lyase activating enzyme